MARVDLKQIARNIDAEAINASATMQLATTRAGRPWNCTVYFVWHSGHFYWLSFPERRHSQELVANPYAAIAIVIQPVQPVVGIQAEGKVEIVHDITEAQSVLDMYIKKYNQGAHFVTNLKEGTNRHNLYRLTPSCVTVFDERGNQTATSPREIVII